MLLLLPFFFKYFIKFIYGYNQLCVCVFLLSPFSIYMNMTLQKRFHKFMDLILLFPNNIYVITKFNAIATTTTTR